MSHLPLPFHQKYLWLPFSLRLISQWQKIYSIEVDTKKTSFWHPQWIHIYACEHVDVRYTHSCMCLHILLHVLKHACSCLPTFTCTHNFIVSYLIVAGFVYYCVFSRGNLEISHRLVSSHDCGPVCTARYVWIKSSMELVLHKVLLWWIWIWNISIICLFYDIDYFRQRPDFLFMNIFLWWTKRFSSFYWWYFFSKHIYKYMNGGVILEGLVELGFCFL